MGFRAPLITPGILWALAVVCVLASSLMDEANARLVTYTWPEEAMFSDKYRVFVACGEEQQREVQVLMSHARYAGDYQAEELKGRTFSFVPVSYDPDGGPLHVRIVKRFGSPSKAVAVSPRSYGIAGRLARDGMQVDFTVDKHSRYLSVNFIGSDNETVKRRWIKHMFCLFVDPVETDAPRMDGAGTVVFTPGTPAASIRDAGTIYFPAGHHNLRSAQPGGIIDRDGLLTLQDGQALYLEGGAVVEGIVYNTVWQNANQRIYGRGVLTGRQYFWHRHPDHSGPEYRHILGIGKDSRVEGVTIIESPNHGIVGRNVKITNVKMLGWHCNNDCVRVGSGSEISHSFFRAVDDHFYNFDIHVHDTVLWAGHNGAILTYGWGGGGTDTRTYNSGSSLLENIDIIHPEWIRLGNNNGLVAAQIGLDYKPFSYGGDATTVVRDIRIEGSIPGLLNLKPRSGSKGEITAAPVNAENVGYLGDLLLENVTVDDQNAKSRIEGKVGPATDGTGVFYVRNVRIRNLRIGGQLVTEENREQFFDIDPESSQDVHFLAPEAAP